MCGTADPCVRCAAESRGCLDHQTQTSLCGSSADGTPTTDQTDHQVSQLHSASFRTEFHTLLPDTPRLGRLIGLLQDACGLRIWPRFIKPFSTHGKTVHSAGKVTSSQVDVMGSEPMAGLVECRVGLLLPVCRVSD